MRFTILFIFSISIFIVSCKPTYRTHVLLNATDYNLVIKGYRTGGNGISSATAEPIFMEPNSLLTFKRTEGEDHDQRAFFSIAIVDSVMIIFDSNRVLSLNCNLQLNTENCHPILEGALEVTITEDDYNNAVPIEE